MSKKVALTKDLRRLSSLNDSFHEKIAEVIPVPKEGNSEEPDNNRPISLLPILSKVSERLAYKQFVEFLTTHDKLSTYQSGNRKMHSTETALINVTDNILKAIDEKSASLLVLLDMSKEFDSLNHNLLLGKLRKLGLKASVISWFSSYLSSRYEEYDTKIQSQNCYP